ncbi:glycosyltransferase family 2 protein [Naasia sp. SYSU D00057]|uniref:glycosyltransferase family 2 protein n=1 Tax=Naasia sp. SYSU D00057 TaxID=2817380 RepID=UPI001B30A5CE|nr:glycosyltransferase family 2 protein [Naasia sp. SYSU D00057]
MKGSGSPRTDASEARTIAPARKPPTITAVVVNYNYAQYVAGAISSVLHQSMPFDQVIVVDDGSTDGSMEVIRSAGTSVTVVEKPNGGPLSAVWAALPATDSDYIYVLDADDLAGSNLVATVTESLGTRPVKVQFQLQAMNSEGDRTESVFPSYASGYGAPRMIDDNRRLGFYVCAPTSGNVFRRDFLADLLGTSELDERGAFDGVPAQLAPYFGQVVSLNTPLAMYRVHDHSLSQYGHPTPELLHRELNRYQQRWAQVVRVLALKGIAYTDPRVSAYVLEREIMAATLDGRRPPLRKTLTYASRLASSGLPLKQRALLPLWALAVVLLPNTTGQALVLARRSPRKRGLVLRWVAAMGRARRREH